MRLLVPRYREMHVDLFEQIGRQHLQEESRIIVDHPDIIDPEQVDLLEYLLCRRGMDLQTDKERIGMLLRLIEQMTP